MIPATPMIAVTTYNDTAMPTLGRGPIGQPKRQ